MDYPRTDDDWEKLAECIVTRHPSVSPEHVGKLTVDATATIFSWYKGEERSKALNERQYARDRLIELGSQAGCVRSFGMDVEELRRRQACDRAEEVLDRISQPLDFSGPYEFKLWDWSVGEIYESTGRYSTPEIAVSGAKDMIESDDFKRDHLKPYERGYQIKVTDGRGIEIPGYDEWYKPRWMLEQQRPFPQTYGDWVSLGVDIKEKAGIDDFQTTAVVNFHLSQIAEEEKFPAEANWSKQMLVTKAGQLGIT